MRFTWPITANVFRAGIYNIHHLQTDTHRLQITWVTAYYRGILLRGGRGWERRKGREGVERERKEGRDKKGSRAYYSSLKTFKAL